MLGEGDDDSYATTSYAPEDILALVLRKVRQEVRGSVGETPDTAVIAVPADFSESARSATRRAAEAAGIEVLQLVSEPSAVCAAHRVGGRDVGPERVVVYDFRESFDVSLVDTTYEDPFHGVIAIDGRRDLGADDFDQALTELIVGEVASETGAAVADDRSKRREVRHNAKTIRESLSRHDTATFRDSGTISGQSFERTITREEFAELTGDLVDRSVECTGELLEDQGLTPGDIDEVLLVGGVTKLPNVKDAVRELFGQDPAHGVDPEEAVAIGAGVVADSTDQSEPLGTRPPTPRRTTTGIYTLLPSDDFELIVREGERLPTIEERTYATVEDQQIGIELRMYRSTAEPPTPDTTEYIGGLSFSGIPERPVGTNFAIQFKIDEYGTLSAAALPESALDPDEEGFYREREAAVTDSLDLPDRGHDPMEGGNVRKPLPEIV